MLGSVQWFGRIEQQWVLSLVTEAMWWQEREAVARRDNAVVSMTMMMIAVNTYSAEVL